MDECYLRRRWMPCRDRRRHALQAAACRQSTRHGHTGHWKHHTVMLEVCEQTEGVGTYRRRQEGR